MKKLSPEETVTAVRVLGNNQGIEFAERVGQQEFVTSMLLPIEGSERPEAQMSPVKWGEPDGRLFRKAELPPGWTKRAAANHAMYSDLLDEKGCVRASIFYKAAFYDERANIHFTPRYQVKDKYHYHEKTGADLGKHTVMCIDTGQGPEPVVLKSVTVEYPAPKSFEDREAWKAADQAKDKLREEMVAWMTEQCPNWKEPGAYWDAP